VALNLSGETVRSIEKGMERFGEHLRGRQNEARGSFDPWRVVEE
jgi:hypothetical protein